MGSKYNNKIQGVLRLTAQLSRFVIIFALFILTACSNSDDDSKAFEENNIAALISYYPENTCGVLKVDVTALASAQTGDSYWLNSDGGVFDQAQKVIKHYFMGADITSAVSHLVLAQTTDVAEGFILIAQLNVEDLTDAFNLAELNQLSAYKGHEVFASATYDLQLTVMGDNHLVIASEAGLRSVIDTASGDASSIASSSIGADLDILLVEEPIAFVYGLPALYKNVKAPGSGLFSLNQAKIMVGALRFSQDFFSGKLSLKSDNAEGFVARFNQIVAGSNTPQLSLGEAGTIDIPIAPVMYSQPDDQQLASLSLLKKLSHGMDAVDYTDAVSHGGNMPWMNFDVGGEPNSIFINFEFKDTVQIAAFEANELPAGFTLAPIRILDSDTPTYFLVLNIYGSSGGLVSGVRAEWSVFVKDPNDDHPRFMVVQAAASDISADSVSEDLLTLPEPVSHELVDDKIRSYVGLVDPDTEEEVNYFTSYIRWPQSPEDRVGFAREFVAANDYIFWGNGVADRGLYNGTVHNREGVRIPDTQIEITDESRWVNYIKAIPKHSYVYLNPLDIVVSPWWNLDADYLDVSADHLQKIINFKNGFYPPTVQGIADTAVAGTGNALSAFTVGKSLPSVYYHFEISDSSAFESFIDLPVAASLAQIRLLEADVDERYYLGLRVYQRDEGSAGKRAEWFTYIADQDGQPYTLLLHVQAEDVLVDPVNWLLLPAVVEHEKVGIQVNTRLLSAGIEFNGATSLGLGQVLPLALDWVEAGDRVCRANGVCDKFYYDGQTMEAPVYMADPSAVNVWKMVTPWDAFIAPQDARAFVRDNKQIFATTPWQNVP